MTSSPVQQAGAALEQGVRRCSRKTPAATIAAECRYAETGVGAAIARGSQKWNGTWAHFARAASAMRPRAMVT